MKGRPFNAREWCDALVARSPDQLEWMAHQPGARAVVNDLFADAGSGGTGLPTPLIWAVRNNVPVERVCYLIDKAGARASTDALTAAAVLNRYDVTRALYRRGARHDHERAFRAHLMLEENGGGGAAGNPGGVLRIILDHPQFWNHRLTLEGWTDLVQVARHRRHCSVRAALALFKTAKQRGLGRDVGLMLARTVMHPAHVVRPEWQNTDPGSLLRRLESISEDRLLFYFAMVVLMVLILMSWTSWICGSVSDASVQPECKTVMCNGDMGDPGPAGPPGPRQVGIQVSSADHNIVIKND